MKNIIKITFSFIAAIVAFACTDKDGIADVGFSLGVYEDRAIEMNAAGGKDIVFVETNESWVATTNVPWITISPANGVGSMSCEVIVDSALENTDREAQIRFKPNASAEKSVKVKQYGFEKMILPKDTVITIEYSANKDERFFETEITSNVDFKVEYDYASGEEPVSVIPWLECKKKQIAKGETARPNTVKLRFDWRMNTAPEERKAKIKFVPVNDADKLDKEAFLSIVQKPAVKIEDNRAGDSIALLVINELLNCWSGVWDTSENLQYWQGVKLWEKTDTALPCPEAVGRVRSVAYAYLNTQESLPPQVKHLKYLESFSVATNVNEDLLRIDLGPEICELQYLKNLHIFSYGLSSLPEEFKNLKKLEVLNLSSNNFTEIPEILTPENFPNLKSLNLNNSRITQSARDLSKITKGDSIGLYLKSSVDGKDNPLRKLLLWEKLEELDISNCYIEGSLPDFKVGEDGVKAYTQTDVDAWGKDTIQYLADNEMPRILPNCTSLKLNLNFFTGDLPDWLRYHPYLLEWIPEILIYNQYEKGKDSSGKAVGFGNVDTTFEYYYEAFPKMRAKYELKEEKEDE